MNKRQKKKKNNQPADLPDLEALTSRIVNHFMDVSKALNQQKVLLEIHRQIIRDLALWQSWRVILPSKAGLYVILQKNKRFGLIRLELGIYRDQTGKALTKQQLDNIVAWYPLPDVPDQITKGGNT